MPFALTARDFLNSGPLTLQVETIALRFDGLSLLLAAIVLDPGHPGRAFLRSVSAGEDGEEKYYAMLLTMIGVMIGLGCAGDLFNLWVWFEAMAVSSYLLVAFYRDQPASLEAGVKYLVQSATGSVLVLMGIALVLMQTGTLDLVQIQQAAVSRPILLAAGALFRDRLWRQDRPGAAAHLAAGCAYPGAERDQRDALGRGDRGRADRDAAGGQPADRDRLSRLIPPRSGAWSSSSPAR